MLQLAMVQPGSTVYDRQGRIQGKLNIPLSDQGDEEVERLIAQLETLPLKTVYTAACQAAEETAERISEALGIKYRLLDSLTNVDHGLWEGMLVDEVKRKHPKVYRRWDDLAENVCPPDGETMGEARDRIQYSLKKILKKHSSGVVAIVLPQPLSSLGQLCLTEGDLGSPWVVQENHTGWNLFAPQGSLVSAGGVKNAS
ncbi:Phosphoglycerate mutase [Planctomycetales bacterium 10988]|nr:Phosphoglycerate mutase [Planctomycetales bacterium 10988]